MTAHAEARRHPRLKLPAMYTVLRVKPQGQKRYCWTGFIYDISESGMRFELDDAVEPGTKLEVHVTLPGKLTTQFTARGQVVRQHDEANEPGPQRMALHFDHFKTEADRHHLNNYLVHAHAA